MVLLSIGKASMKKIHITDSLENLKLKVGEKVELFKRVWQYGETTDKSGKVTSRYLDPM